VTAADDKYNGQTLQVSGEVKEIERFPLIGSPYVTLDCRFPLLSNEVWCYFDQADEAQLELLQQGDWVSVRGEGASTTLAGQSKLEQCTIDSESTPTPTPTSPPTL